MQTLKRSAMEKLYGTWLPQSVAAGGKYDIMISYRQATEREFAHALSDCFSVEAVGESGAVPTVFYDQVSLKAGERFDLAFMNAIAHSRVCVPLVSEGAVSRMMDITQLDNVLLEWALMTFLQTQEVIARVQPVLLGAVSTGGQMRSLFTEFNVDTLPDMVNEAVQTKVRVEMYMYFSFFGGVGGSLLCTGHLKTDVLSAFHISPRPPLQLEDFVKKHTPLTQLPPKRTVRAIVQEVLTYSAVLAWDLDGTQSHAGEVMLASSSWNLHRRCAALITRSLGEVRGVIALMARLPLCHPTPIDRHVNGAPI